MEKEIWKDIIGWEGKYQVSNLGRVKRLNQLKPVRGQSDRFYPERICSTRNNKHGYVIVSLWDKGYSSNKQIHRLMAEAFIPNPKKLEQVNHKNGVKDDNRLENLEWISRSGNALHAVYELKKQSGLSSCKKIQCVETQKIYPSIHSAARDINAIPICISRVANGERQTFRGMHWKFL